MEIKYIDDFLRDWIENKDPKRIIVEDSYPDSYDDDYTIIYIKNERNYKWLTLTIYNDHIRNPLVTFHEYNIIDYPADVSICEYIIQYLINKN